MFFKKIQKIIIFFLILLMLIPSVFFIEPTKTEAAYPVEEVGPNLRFNAATSLYSGTSATANTSLLKKETVLDAIFWGLKEILIRQIVASTVDWINSGFEGNPAFVTDLNGLLTSTADAVIGEWILGSKLNFLCSPFSLAVRLTLLQQFTGLNEPRCTLSEVTENIDSAISDLNNQWNWDTWNSITQNSNNNAYGTYIEVSQMINDDIARETNNLVRELGWGDGFLSWKECPEDGVGPCQILTPGSVIASTLNEHINMGGRELIEADEINEIVGALFGQLIKKVVGPEGLLSASSGSSGESSLVDRLSTEQIDLTRMVNQIIKLINTDIDMENDYINIKSDSLDALRTAKYKLEILIDCYESSTSTNEYLIESAYGVIDNQIQPKIDRLTNQVNNSYLNIQELDSIKSSLKKANNISTVNYLVSSYEEIKTSGDFVTVEDIVSAEIERDGSVNPGIIESMNVINTSTDQKLLICQSGL